MNTSLITLLIVGIALGLIIGVGLGIELHAWAIREKIKRYQRGDYD